MAITTPVWIRMRNFLRYGDNDTTFYFDKGLGSIRGANGRGKSTVLDALYYAIYGETLRPDYKLGDLINSENEKRLEVEFEFITKEAGVERVCRIMRGQKPARFRLFIDDVLQDEEGTGGAFQERIVNELIGIPSALFKAVIIIRASDTPLLKMKAADKRKFIEAVLNASDHTKVQKECMSALSAVRDELSVLNGRLPQQLNTLEQLEELLAAAIDEKKVGLEELRTEASVLSSELSDLLLELESAGQSVVDIKAKGMELKAEYDSRFTKLNDQIGRLEYGITSAQSDVKVKTDRLAKTRSEVNTAHEWDDEAYGHLKETLNELKASHAELVEKSNDRTSENEMVKINSLISTCKIQIKKLTDEFESHEVGVPCTKCGKPSTEDDVLPHKDRLRSEISELERQVRELYESIPAHEASIAKIKAFREEAGLVAKKIDQVNGSIRDMEISNAAYNQALKNIEVLEEDIRKVETTIPMMESELEALKLMVPEEIKLSAEINAFRDKYAAAKTTYDVTNVKVSGLQARLNNLEKTISEKSQSNPDDIIASTNEKITRIKRDIEMTKASRIEKSEDIKEWEYIITKFKDEGIKEYLLRRYIPILNESISRILKRFNLPYNVEFDSYMDYTFQAPPGEAVGYGGLSGGQAARVDFAISVAFREFVSRIGRFNFDALFLDEVLDKYVDGEGLADMVDIIEALKDSIHSIYMITQRNDSINVEFDSIYEACSSGKFNQLDKLL